MKYPNIIFFRYKKYLYIDNFFEINKNFLLCNLNITDDKDYLNNLFNSSYHLLITFGDDQVVYYEDVYSIIANRMAKRWIHFNEITCINTFNNSVNYCYIDNVLLNNEITRPIFSVFTSCYNSYDKINRGYNSLKEQILKDWEWVILDDSPDDLHFDFLKKIFANDKRVRLYKRDENSGNIGNVKNEVVSLCRGKYLIELDHDDEILPHLLSDSVNIFENDNDVGFIYANYINIYENGDNFCYGNFVSLGYGAYYNQKYKGKWVNVASSPNINNVTLSNIVSIPNHPRIWKKDILIKIGNYSEFLPISDDYELLLRTAVNTKIVKLNKFSYIQYMNDNNNNFSLIRNGEINRICRDYIKPQAFIKYNIIEKMSTLDAYEDESYAYNHSQIWKRSNFIHKYCNEIKNIDYTKTYCIIGMEIFMKNIDMIRFLYNDDKNDFIILDNKCDNEYLCTMLDNFHFDRMKCYAINDVTDEELINYFNLIYKSDNNVVFI